MNVFDGLPSTRKLDFITSRAIPTYAAFESQCTQLVEAYHRKIKLCYERFESSASLEEKKFYGEQVFRLFYTVYEEFKALQTGSYHLSHHLNMYSHFEHNRSKERYRYKTNFLSICSIDGLQYELHELKSRMIRNSSEIEFLQNQVDAYGHKYTEIYNVFMQSMADFVFKITGMRLEKPQDSLIEKGIFKCPVHYEDSMTTITFIPKRMTCYPISSILANQVIEEFEGSQVRKVLKPLQQHRIQDEEAQSTKADTAVDESIQAIKEQYGKSDPIPATRNDFMHTTAEVYHLEIALQVKYTTLGADDRLVKASQHRILRFKRY